MLFSGTLTHLKVYIKLCGTSIEINIKSKRNSFKLVTLCFFIYLFIYFVRICSKFLLFWENFGLHYFLVNFLQCPSFGSCKKKSNFIFETFVTVPSHECDKITRMTFSKKTLVGQICLLITR
jgi:hypothetical protein